MNQATHNVFSSLSTEQLSQLCADSGYLDMEFHTAELIHFYENGKGEHVYSYSTTCDDMIDGGVLRGHVYVAIDPATGDTRVEF